MPLKGFLFSSVKLILNVTGAISLMQSIGMFHLAGPRARAGTSWFLFLLSAILRLQWRSTWGLVIMKHCSSLSFWPIASAICSIFGWLLTKQRSSQLHSGPTIGKNAGLRESQWKLWALRPQPQRCLDSIRHPVHTSHAPTATMPWGRTGSTTACSP